MTRKQLEQLVLCFENHNELSYEDLLKQDIPASIIYEGLISVTPSVIELKTSQKSDQEQYIYCSGSYIQTRIHHHGFDNDDIFRLTEFVANQLYVIQKEQHSIQLSKAAVKYAKLACILTVVIPIMQFLYQLLCGYGK